MVHVVDKSHYGYGYREINQQLARSNGELRQQLSTVINENLNQREEIHRRDVQIVELKSQLNELASIREKYDAIRDIVTGKRQIESIQQQQTHHQTTSIQALTESQCESRNSPLLRLPSTSQNTSIDNSQVVSEPCSPTNSSASTRTAVESSHDGDQGDEQEEGESTFEVDNSRRMTENILEPIVEMNSEEEDEDEDDMSRHNNSNQSSLPSPSRPNTPVNDSLEPPNVTSVPQINHQERTMHTPSIYNFLDPPESDQPHQLSQRSIQSPARSAGSSTSVGLRLSNNINSSSPIHPISRKANPNINADMFQSTPVQVQKNINITTALFNKRSVSDPKSFNQENNAGCVQENDAREIDHENVATATTKPKKGRAKKQPVRRAVKFTRDDEEAQDAPPARYNLRKRAKI